MLGVKRRREKKPRSDVRSLGARERIPVKKSGEFFFLSLFLPHDGGSWKLDPEGGGGGGVVAGRRQDGRKVSQSEDSWE